MGNSRNTEVDFFELGNEFVTRRYYFNKVQVSKVLEVSDYIAMHIIAQESAAEDGNGKMYLKDLSERMHFTINQTSKLAGALEEKGLVHWTHDGKGSDGTYVTVTPLGWEKLRDQEALIKEFYGNVIQKFGRENLIQLINLMKELEIIMENELDNMEK